MLSANNLALVKEKPTKSYESDLVGWVYAELPEIYQDYVDRVAAENGVTQLDLYPLMRGIHQMLAVCEQRTLLLRAVQRHYGAQDYPPSKAYCLEAA